MSANPRQDFGYSRTVSYVNRNHLSLICQRWGSVTRKVIPFCAANVLLSVFLVWLLEHGIDLSISEFGHEFMSILVTFLVINKLGFTLGLYYELQGYLAKMNQSSIELTQLACSFTSGYQQQEYVEWRSNVTFHVLLLLGSTVSMIYKGGEENVWEAPPLQDDPLLLFVDENSDTPTNQTRSRPSHLPKELYVWGCQFKSDKNLRVPVRIAQRLRDAIVSQKSLPTAPLNDFEQQNLLDLTKEFMDSYYGIRKYLTCPLPLPLVQLGRVFLMFYVYTLPFALLSPELNLQYVQMISLTFIMTYGFVGIELLFVEIDDPFAEDPNDLPLAEESRAAAEDVLLSIMQADGRSAVNRLRKRLSPDGRPGANAFRDDFHDQVRTHGPLFFNYGTAKESDPLV
mmetsp:Transcript_17118/g.37130  ORF Transcript_17118/g.37130 Transcript_17118/m.37130 type:complete len:398 (-) Transcript_17118:135-1328(-)